MSIVLSFSYTPFSALQANSIAVLVSRDLRAGANDARGACHLIVHSSGLAKMARNIRCSPSEGWKGSVILVVFRCVYHKLETRRAFSRLLERRHEPLPYNGCLRTLVFAIHVFCFPVASSFSRQVP